MRHERSAGRERIGTRLAKMRRRGHRPFIPEALFVNVKVRTRNLHTVRITVRGSVNVKADQNYRMNVSRRSADVSGTESCSPGCG
jgi:hypothetical protein